MNGRPARSNKQNLTKKTFVRSTRNKRAAHSERKPLHAPDTIELSRKIREHQASIEQHNREIRKAVTELVKRGHGEDPLQKTRHALERTIEDRTVELKNAYELLNSIFASIDVHIAYLDPDFNYFAVNRVYAAAAGRTPDFYPGKNYFDCNPGEETEEVFRDVVETGEPYYEYEKPVVSGERPERGVTYWNWSVQPVKGPGEAVRGLVLSMIDVTDRKRAEENTISLAAAIESAGDAVIITDVRGMIKYVNAAFEAITGYSRKEAIGRDKYMLESGKQDEAFYQNVRETIRQQGYWTGRVISKKKDGTLYTEECTCSLIRNQSGEIINYVSIGRDITEKLRQSEILSQRSMED